MIACIEDELYARALGWDILTLMRRDEEHFLALRQEIDSDAIRALEQIKRIVNDDTIEDPDCFERIELIVRTFYANGLSTSRHDWG